MDQIYKSVRLIFISALLSLVGALLLGALAVLGTPVLLAGGVLTFAALYGLRGENPHFEKSLRALWWVVGTIVAAVAVLFLGALLFTSVLAEAGEPGGNALSFLVMAAPFALSVACLIFAVRMQHQLYSGLEEVRETRQLDFPPRRILWGFYLMLIDAALNIVFSVAGLSHGLDGASASLAASGLFALLSLLVGFIRAWILYGYMQSVRNSIGYSSWQP